MKLTVDNQLVTLDELRRAWLEPVTVELGDEARRRIAESNELIDEVVAHGDTVYGVNTGFGQLASERVSDDELAHLQENLVRSHAVGVGEELDDAVVRLVMLMKVVALAEGFSGVRLQLVETLCALINAEIYPLIPSRGSVGASGDLAPLAHMAGALIGIGEVRVGGNIVPAPIALKEAGIEPLQLAPKEGLALLNGTQVSTALALAAVFRTENVLAAALMAGAMSSDAIKGSDVPFDRRIQIVRGHGGQIAVAGVLRDLMRDSEIRASHAECHRVQDPYSIRCQPQVVGACLDVLRHVCKVLETEANAVTDNPLVFVDSGAVLSGGNFHAEPVALAADYLALAIAEIGALSERRIALLIDAHLSGLPAFLVEEGGLNSGFMMAQVTAAALASENKSHAHPASVDSLPTSANQEDHVSMAAFAARRLHTMIDNVADIVAIELLAAAQGIEFRRPAKSSPPIEEVVVGIRALSPPYDQDRSLAADIRRVAATVDAGAYCRYAESVLPSLSR
ncbi:MAG: histidine ammonia-lyase [Gammaproteobacteria bacterium]|nr:histidine ammonia-lyase [Gammaproteobacteria bacterium]NNF48830.1 histidine ammonia-lyase [Woeseiaceae bacterium]MBT8093808.1 histidine ammonia-lyase [Gammaproteobacteria bacterium]MBT8105892.1 histidine ammonia-lyase [Gammaproteobacteria bacterium]NNK25906.1 histidine ammonia-lyase [Woeseiaceae bacterium]